MASQKEWEKRIWGVYAAEMNGTDDSELVEWAMNVRLDSLSEAEYIRFQNAREKVTAALWRKARL